MHQDITLVITPVFNYPKLSLVPHLHSEAAPVESDRTLGPYLRGAALRASREIHIADQLSKSSCQI